MKTPMILKGFAARENDMDNIVKAFDFGPGVKAPPSTPAPNAPPPLGKPAAPVQAPPRSPFDQAPGWGWSGVKLLQRGLPRALGAAGAIVSPDAADGALSDAEWRRNQMWKRQDRPAISQAYPQDLPSFTNEPEFERGRIVLPLERDAVTWQPVPLLAPGPEPDMAPHRPPEALPAPLSPQRAVGAGNALPRGTLDLRGPTLDGVGRWSQRETIPAQRLSVEASGNRLRAVMSDTRVQERRNRRSRDVKFQKWYGAILNTVTATYGAATEVIDAYDAFAQNLWYELPSGQLVRAVSFMDRWEAGMSWIDGRSRLDLAGFGADYMLAQVTDRIYAKWGRAWQSYANQLGWSKPVGLETYTHFLRKGQNDVWSVYGASLASGISDAREWVLPSRDVRSRLLW